MTATTTTRRHHHRRGRHGQPHARTRPPARSRFTQPPGGLCSPLQFRRRLCITENPSVTQNHVIELTTTEDHA